MMSNGSGSLLGSVATKNTGPKRYSAPKDTAIYTRLFIFLSILEVYKNFHRALQTNCTQITLLTLSQHRKLHIHKKHRFGHGARFNNKHGARTTNPLL